jgi:undecaprenyl-diphosphatase
MPNVSQIDASIALFFNQFINRSLPFDMVVAGVAVTNLLKGGVIIAMAVWCWTLNDGKIDVKALKVIFGALIAIIVGRVIQNNFFEHPRPIHNPDLHLTISGFLHDSNLLEGWSSFPSDHAVMVFAISTGIWSFDRRWGALAFIWSIVIVSFPRVYLGLHYFSDVLCGAVLGWLIMSLILFINMPPSISQAFEALQRRHAKFTYATMFLVTLEIATMFEGSRNLLRGVGSILH